MLWLYCTQCIHTQLHTRTCMSVDKYWMVRQGSDINHHSVRDIDQNLPNANIVLYRRHCDICAGDF